MAIIMIIIIRGVGGRMRSRKMDTFSFGKKKLDTGHCSKKQHKTGVRRLIIKHVHNNMGLIPSSSGGEEATRKKERKRRRCNC